MHTLHHSPHHSPHNDAAHHHPYEHYQTSNHAKNKRNLLIGILIALLMIAGVAIGMQTESLKGLLAEKTPHQSAQKTSESSESVVAEQSAVLNINDAITLEASPAIGLRVEKELKNGVEIGKIKLQNNGAESITFDRIKFTDRGFATNAPVYELFVSKENSQDYEKVGSASGTPEFKLETPVSVSAGAYRNLSVRIKNAETLDKGNIFMLELKSLGNLKLGQNGTVKLGAVMLK